MGGERPYGGRPGKDRNEGEEPSFHCEREIGLTALTRRSYSDFTIRGNALRLTRESPATS